MKKLYLWVFVALLIGYVALAFLLPADPAVLERYQITQSQARMLNLSLVLPLVAIYLTALYGFLRFKAYAETVQKTKEGQAYQQLANGLMVLAFSLPIMSIATSWLNYVAAKNPDLLPTITIGRNYLRLILTVIAFTLIASGSEKLVMSVKAPRASDRPLVSLLGIIVLSSLFTWLIISKPASELNDPAYFLPSWLLISTLAIPYLFIWCRGLRGAYHLFKYKDKVGGKIYRKALGYLAKGNTFVIVVSIFIQLLTMAMARLISLNLTPLLLIIYVLIIFYAVGFSFISSGSKQLQKIEEV